MRIFGIDPGSDRTGYGCLDAEGSRYRLVSCGSLAPPRNAPFPVKLQVIHDGLLALIRRVRPECAVVENVFHARNVRSALKLGHARGVVLLAASEAGVPVMEYTPSEIKRAVVGYGRAEKQQVQAMVQLLLGLSRLPAPDDVADALAAAICHTHVVGAVVPGAAGSRAGPRSWRDYRPAGPTRG